MYRAVLNTNYFFLLTKNDLSLLDYVCYEEREFVLENFSLSYLDHQQQVKNINKESTVSLRMKMHLEGMNENYSQSNEFLIFNFQNISLCVCVVYVYGQ